MCFLDRKHSVIGGTWRSIVVVDFNDLFCAFGLIVQKHSAHGDAYALSRDNNTVSYICGVLVAYKDKSVLFIICSEKGCYSFAFRNTD